MGRAGLAAMVGYEVGQITNKETMHVEIPNPTYNGEMYRNNNVQVHDNTSIKEILYVVIFMLMCIMVGILSRFLKCKTPRQENRIQL